jgi:hypothetical protein
MIRELREWWRTLGYCNGRRNGEFRTWGIRPWVGGPWLWFTIDVSESAKPVGATEAKR